MPGKKDSIKDIKYTDFHAALHNRETGWTLESPWVGWHSRETKVWTQLGLTKYMECTVKSYHAAVMLY